MSQSAVQKKQFANGQSPPQELTDFPRTFNSHLVNQLLILLDAAFASASNQIIL